MSDGGPDSGPSLHKTKHIVMIRKTGHFGRVPVVIAILTAGLGFVNLILRRVLEGVLAQ
jgi:hypothetical protein